MSSEQTRVALYGRISEDKSGEAVGVDRQLGDGEKLARGNGWDVVASLSDNDISALKGRHRPGYSELMRLAAEQKIDRIICWQMSRLWRNRRERAEAIETLAKARVSVTVVKGQDLELETAYGRGIAGLLGEFDTWESEVKSERVTAAAADRAAKGNPAGGLGYGWTKVGVHTYVVDDEQAEVVRDITRRLTAGESLRAVTEDLNVRGIPAPNSASWGKTSVKKLALRESNAGLRVHHRGRPTERLYDGTWPALVAREEWERVTARLTVPERRTNATVARPGARTHLLTWGIGECGVCGGRLRAATKQGKYGKPMVLYVCDDKGCVGRNEAKVDDLVEKTAVLQLSRPDWLGWLAGDEDESRRLSKAIAKLQTQVDDAADRFADGKWTATQVDRVNERLLPKIEELRAQQRRTLSTLDMSVLGDMIGPKASEAWAKLGDDVTRKRAVLEAMGTRVVVNKTSRRGPVFNPDDVDVEFGVTR